MTNSKFTLNSDAIKSNISIKIISLTYTTLLVVAISGCQSSKQPSATRTTKVIQPPKQTSTVVTNHSSSIPESWRLTPITTSETDSAYKAEWKKSEIGRKCPLLVLPSTANSHLIDRNVRRANFSGGWGVAYDLPDVRSAYGVALSGISDPVGKGSIWNDYHVYQDGTELTYGREGGDPNGKWLAYLTLGDNYCFYNIWSTQGKSHLEQIISELRVVKP